MKTQPREPVQTQGAEDDPLRRLKIVLIQPIHAGNLGAAARAMKNMGVPALRLVAPSCGHLTPEALKMAYGSHDVLTNAAIHPTLETAVADVGWVVGLTMPRPGRPETLSLAEAVPDIVRRLDGQNVALLFGSEISGLSNSDLAICHQLVAIPTSPSQPSLNLAQAVLVACYELRQAVGWSAQDRPAAERAPDQQILATTAELNGLYEHLAQTLTAIGFLHAPHDRHVLGDIRALMSRARLGIREVRLFRGILRQVDWALEHPHSDGTSPRT